MRASLSSLLVLVGATLACDADRVFGVEIDREIVFLGSVAKDGAVTKTSVVVGEQGDPVRLPSAEGAQLFIVGLGGADLSYAGELSFAGAGDAPCGRCAAPGSTAPQPLIAGDACPPPAFAEVTGWIRTADGIEALPADEAQRGAARFRIVLPGDCAAPPRPPNLGSVEVCPLAPTGGPLNAQQIVVTDDADAYGLGPGFAWSFDAAAVRSTRFDPPHQQIFAAAPHPAGGVFYSAQRKVVSDTKTDYRYMADPAATVARSWERRTSRPAGSSRSNRALHTWSGAFAARPVSCAAFPPWIGWTATSSRQSIVRTTSTRSYPLRSPTAAPPWRSARMGPSPSGRGRRGDANRRCRRAMRWKTGRLST